MAENIIKDFVKKQTTPVTIGVPKARTAVTEKVQEVEEPAGTPVETAPVGSSGRVGRPRTYEKRTKLSMYLPEELKDKLVKIQHHNYKPSLNDVLLEAIQDLLKKYDY
ncbi:MAG: hypothetical protein ACI4UJ_04890 [Candidatus Cryptobacteroides sp.]